MLFIDGSIYSFGNKTAKLLFYVRSTATSLEEFNLVWYAMTCEMSSYLQ